ncbi:hypothetical protein [Saccharopolyspora sp. CA-218241]|uniref:Uncharacterized protein n=2 Tax=Saccharopolyspora cebuensis TaxID=418759 RepID=A0ABV4CFR8_9PSEU
MDGSRADGADPARGFGELADRAERIADALRRALSDAGECWGQDDVGTAFAAAHRDPARSALERVAALPERLRDFGAAHRDAGQE